MFFKKKKDAKLMSILAQSRLLLSRVNEDEDLQIPSVTSMLKKDYQSYDDEFYSTFESALLIAKKIEEYKMLDNEIDSHFLIKAEAAIEHVFRSLNYLEIGSEDDQKLENFVLDFYKNKNVVPSLTDFSNQFPKPVCEGSTPFEGAKMLIDLNKWTVLREHWVNKKTVRIHK